MSALASASTSSAKQHARQYSRRSIDEILATVAHEAEVHLEGGRHCTVVIPEADRLAEARMIMFAEDDAERAAHPSACSCQLPPPEALAFIPTVDALADAMRANRHNATEDVLAALGFSPAFQHRHRDEAVALARRASVDQVGDETAEDEEALVARMRVAVGELLPSLQFTVTELQCRGFTKRQMDRYLRRAINLAARDFAAVAQPRPVQ